MQYVADNIVKAIRMYNEIHCSNEVYEESQPFVLGLTTGRTPLGLYRELVKRHHEGQISFRNVAVYSLDEFYPIRSTEQQSRNYRIHEEFLNHIDILPENVHIPDGTVPEDSLFWTVNSILVFIVCALSAGVLIPLILLISFCRNLPRRSFF